MRNMFSKFFGSKMKKVVNESVFVPVSNDESSLADKPIARDLFVNDEGPSSSRSEKAERQSVVSAFLQTDHYTFGVEEGYNQHSAEFMRKQVNAMASTFRRLLYEESEDHRSKISELKMNLAQIGEQFPEIKQQLLLRIEEHQSKIDFYLIEGQNSIELDGLISSPVKAYEAGYEAGLKQYLDEKGFLNSFTL